jgi:hypothetical protein
MTKFMETVIKKVDGLATDVRTNSFTLDKFEARLGGFESKFETLEEKVDLISSDLKVLSGQFSDVGVVAIKDHKRIEILEKRVDDIEAGVH